jgi:branched-chain amino acid transport system substrate-binding protein
VDVIVDTPNSGVALAVNQITKDKGKVFINSGRRQLRPHRQGCSPNTVHWTYDTWMLANGTGKAIVKTGGDTWFFITADYAFGHALERDTEAVVVKNGGKVLGKVRARQHAGLLVLPAAGAGVQGQDHRPRERRRRHHQLDQAGVRVRHREGRPEPRGPAGVPHRRARLGSRRRRA